MANPEKFQNEPSIIEGAEKKLADFLAGAEIGSPKLLAYSDELQRRSLWNRVNVLPEPDAQVLGSYQRIAEQELALLQLQIINRNVEIKGYSTASFKIEGLLSDLATACRIEFYQDNSFSPQEKAQLEKDSFLEVVWGLYNSLTKETEK